MTERIEYMLSRISDPDIRQRTQELLESIPEYFEGPASTSGKYHPEDECAEYGMLLHVERVVCCCEELCIAYEISGIWKDRLISAAILHDGWRHMKDIAPHDIVGYIKCCEIPEMVEVGEIIAGHEGRWGSAAAKRALCQTEDPFSILSDTDFLGKLLHEADYICSRRSLWKKMQHA